MRHRRYLRIACAAGLIVTAAACGSTVEPGAVPGAGSGLSMGGPAGPASQSLSTGSGVQASLGAGSGSGVAAAGAGSAGGAAAALSGGGSTGSGANGNAPASGPAGAAAATSGDGPGVTASTIYVAGLYSSQTAAADQAIGAANANPGDTKAETDAVVSYINSHGGVDHRKLAMVWYDESLSNDANTTYQQACAAWTQDARTFVMLAGAQILDQCTANEHAVAIYVGEITSETTATMASYPADIDLDGLTNDRAMRYTIDGLARQGYFSQGAKVGIATWDDPNFSFGVTHAALPALAALGYHNVPVAYITSPQSYNDLGSTSASVSSAILKFRQEGIDHVLLFDGASGVTSSGVLVLEWMQQANSQAYYPKYGLNSTSGFNALVGDVPEREEVGSVGVSWEPPLDETSAAFSATPLSPLGKLCLQIMKNAGQQASSNNAVVNQLGICDQLFFVQHVFDSVRGPLDQSSALAALNAVGTGWSDLTTFGVNLTSGRHDGVYQVRNMAFDTSCTCYQYTGSAYHPSG